MSLGDSSCPRSYLRSNSSVSSASHSSDGAGGSAGGVACCSDAGSGSGGGSGIWCSVDGMAVSASSTPKRLTQSSTSSDLFFPGPFMPSESPTFRLVRSNAICSRKVSESSVLHRLFRALARIWRSDVTISSRLGALDFTIRSMIRSSALVPGPPKTYRTLCSVREIRSSAGPPSQTSKASYCA